MTTWLSAEEQRCWRAYLGAAQRVLAVIDGQLLRDADLPLGYYEILVRLSEAPGRAQRMSELAEAVRCSRSRLSHAVARLEDRGWVRRAECATDRRGQVAELTDEGYVALAAAAPGHVAAVQATVFAGLTPEQVAELGAASEAILRRLDLTGPGHGRPPSVS